MSRVTIFGPIWTPDLETQQAGAVRTAVAAWRGDAVSDFYGPDSEIQAAEEVEEGRVAGRSFRAPRR